MPEPDELSFCTDAEPGIRRRGTKRVTYVDAAGRPVRDEATLARIRALAVPPAWTDVWICPSPAGHIQATGRDAKGRKQYRYHADFRAQREASKFADLIPFGESLGRLRKQVDADLRLGGLPEERVLALVIALLDRTHMRVGNEEYMKGNKTFGLTTLQDRHVRFSGTADLRLCFVGKGGRAHDVCVGDRSLARLVRRCRDLPGQQLFQWVDDDGGQHGVGSSAVNARIRTLTGLDHASAKTFRTWAASVRAAELLAAEEPPSTKREATATLLSAVDAVADDLGNTRTVARASYVHPSVPAAYEAGKLPEWWADGPSRAAAGLHPDERRLLLVLRRARRAGLGVSAPVRKRRPRHAGRAAAA